MLIFGEDNMFIGAINQDTRAILYEMAKDWKCKEIYVGCSGNFTVERVLNEAGIENIHSNDVSLYSCCIGRYLTGKKINVKVVDKRFEWLEEYMKTGLDIIATLLLCSEMFKYVDKEEIYYKRMYNAYLRRYKKLHEQTKEKIGDTLDNMKIKSFYAGDVLKFIKNTPKDAVVISFPPTYKGGYERLYKSFNSL